MTPEEELNFIKRWKNKRLRGADIVKLTDELPSIANGKEFQKFMEKNPSEVEIKNFLREGYKKQLKKLDGELRKREIQILMEKLLKR